MEENDQYSNTGSESYSESEDDNMLAGMSEEQRVLMEKKLREYQDQFKSFNINQETQKIQDVLQRVPGIDEKTAKLAIDSCRNNELLAIKRLLDDADYKKTVWQMAHGEIDLDMTEILYRDKVQELREALQDDEDDLEEDDEGDDWGERRKRHHHVSHSGDESDHSSGSRKRSHPEGKSERKLPRLNLDDALIMLASLKSGHSENDQKEEEEGSTVKPSTSSEVVASPSTHSESEGSENVSGVTPDHETVEIPVAKKPKTKVNIEQEAELFRSLSGSSSDKIPEAALRKLGWSEARIKAFQNREKNPNQYYYRFNDPGEPQATGKWSPKDKALFLKLVAKGVDYQWGIFSMQIPGRVGYQCSNYYRQLIKEGVIRDENYSFDENGKLVFKFRDSEGKSTLVHGKKDISGNPVKPKRTRKRIIRDPVEFSDPEPEVKEVNVLPDFIDQMTMMPVVKPAISPYGHVLGYDSWVKVLNRNPKNTCPFTKKKLTRRSLVKLTPENIEEYRDKIINVPTSFENDLH